jgi:hypothetical protein
VKERGLFVQWSRPEGEARPATNDQAAAQR